MTHDELVGHAKRWLKSINCRALISELASAAEEEPDAIGWRSGVSILVECKASRSDFLADKKKKWRIKPSKGMGSWRFFMCEAGLIKPEELPEKWGLVYVIGKKFEIVEPNVIGNCWFREAVPFKPNMRHEIDLLVSAFSRINPAKTLNLSTG